MRFSNISLVISLLFLILLLMTACEKETNKTITKNDSTGISGTQQSSSAQEAESDNPAITPQGAPVEENKDSTGEISNQENSNAGAILSDNSAAKQTVVLPVSSYEKKLALAKKSGCLTCHSVDKKVVGPAWKDVAARYKGDANARSMLIDKVSKGGKGNWTDITGGVPMPPYHPRVSRENIEQLVDFVLSL